MDNCLKEFKRWLELAKEDSCLIDELNSIKENEEKIKDAFYKDLEFGTGGLRGVIGAGTNRMNIYTVRKATQGIANYVLKHVKESDRKVAISYDSRINSDVFAKAAAGVLAANGIKAFIYKTLMPVPCLSYATRELKCSFGIMITASHNPSKYNGYKVYGGDGCQVISEVADSILNEINSLDIFTSIKTMNFEDGLSKGLINYIPDTIYDSFVEEIKRKTMLFGEEVDKKAKIIYSPLHGTGLKPVTRVLKEVGFNDVIVVKEQELPDGHFTTCPYPNPEIKEAMQLGIEYAKKNNADLLVATDPDCDRVGIAVKDNNDEFVLLSGNETGCLLLNYILEQRSKNNALSKTAVAVKTIVTTDLAKRICDKYGVKLLNVLTGFKYIGEQIAILENENRVSDYLFGFEESYGYLSGTHVRDKDGVNAVFLIVEMFAYYKTHGVSLFNKLQALYQEFGLFGNYLKSYEFEGISGYQKMQDIMTMCRTSLKDIAGMKINELLDYEKGVNGLPTSNVLQFVLDNVLVTVRPSGTEPKLKIYLSIRGKNKKENDETSVKIFSFFEGLFR